MATNDAPKPLPADNAVAIAHMNLLQGIINRLATTSASCKTWCLALVGALLSFASATQSPGIVTVAVIPVVVFGVMDTMYLANERAYRELFNDVARKIQTQSYTTADSFRAGVAVTSAHVLRALRSWAILPIYGGLIVLYLVAYFAGWLSLLTAPAAR